MKSTQTMTNEELYNIGACDYDSVYMSQVRTGLFDRHPIIITLPLINKYNTIQYKQYLYFTWQLFLAYK